MRWASVPFFHGGPLTGRFEPPAKAISTSPAVMVFGVRKQEDSLDDIAQLAHVTRAMHSASEYPTLPLKNASFSKLFCAATCAAKYFRQDRDFFRRASRQRRQHNREKH